MDTSAFVEQFRPLADWYGRTPSRLVVEVYYEYLQHLSPEALRQAIKTAIATESYMPTAEKLAGLAGKTIQQEALEQWRKAIAYASIRKTFRETDLDECTVSAIRLMTTHGSLAELGNVRDDQMDRRAKQFVDLYQQSRRQIRATVALPPAPSSVTLSPETSREEAKCRS